MLFGLQVSFLIVRYDLNLHFTCKGLSDLFGLLFRKFKDPSEMVASTALRVTVNGGPSSFYGEKYSVDKVVEFFSSMIRHQLFSRFSRTQVILLLGSPLLCMIPSGASCICMVHAPSLFFPLGSVDFSILQVWFQHILPSVDYDFDFVR